MTTILWLYVISEDYYVIIFLIIKIHTLKQWDETIQKAESDAVQNLR